MPNVTQGGGGVNVFGLDLNHPRHLGTTVHDKFINKLLNYIFEVCTCRFGVIQRLVRAEESLL